jgi:squalene-hopene/tetraprenyl-beta-curcumene cyclase
MTTIIPQDVIQRFAFKSIFTRVATGLAFSAALGFAADWDPAAAARYLDSRQEKWFVWPNSASKGGPCMSCHTGLTYILARPVLRRALGETAPARWETGMLEGLKARVDDNPAPEAADAQPVLAALVLAMDDQRSGRRLSRETEAAFRRMWRLQVGDGMRKGAFPWNNSGRDPYSNEATYLGASLAALAVAIAPGNYGSRPEIRRNLDALEDYLRNSVNGQPLHHRLISLWASAKLKGLLPEPAAEQILKETWRGQEADGGWTLKSLGPWKDHPQVPPQPGSNAYATALVALSVQEYGISPEDPRVVKALNWLKAHQDSHDGAWAAASLNKQYEAGSMQIEFMRDAATGFAVLALLGGTGLH